MLKVLIIWKHFLPFQYYKDDGNLIFLQTFTLKLNIIHRPHCQQFLWGLLFKLKPQKLCVLFCLSTISIKLDGRIVILKSQQ